MSIYVMAAAKLAEKGTTKQRLAGAMGLSTVTSLNKKLRLESEMTIAEGRALASFLDISVDELCALIDDERPCGR